MLVYSSNPSTNIFCNFQSTRSTILGSAPRYQVCVIIRTFCFHIFTKLFIFRVILNAKTSFGFYINLLPQALTGCNTWVTWILFLSFFIGLLTYVAAFVNDFELNITNICDYSNGDNINQKHKVLTETIQLHSELTE